MRYIVNIGDKDCSFHSIVKAVMFAYGHDRCFIKTKHNVYNFDINYFTKDVDNSCLYDSFFAAWISIFMTRSERDKFIKTLRGEK